VPRLSTLLRGKFGRRRSVGLRKLAGARPASNFERCISTAGWSLYERSVSGNKKRKVVAGDTHNSVAGSSNATRVQTRMVKIVATSKTIDEALESAVVELLGMMELGWLEQEKCPNPGDTLKRLARYAPGSCDPVLIAAMKPVTLSPQCFGVSPALGVSPGKEFVDLLVGGAGEEEVQERWRRLGGWLQGALNGLEQIRSKLGCVHYCISARSLLTDVQCSPLILELGGVQAIGEASAAHYGAGSVWAPPSRLKKNPSRDPVHAGADMTAAGLVLIWNAVCPQKNSKKNLRELYDFHAEAEPACVRMMLEALADALEGHSHSSTAIKSNGNGVPLPGPLSRIEASEKAPGGARRRAWAGTLARRFVSVVEGKAGAPCGGANEKKVVIMRLVRLLREDEPISGVIVMMELTGLRLVGKALIEPGSGLRNKYYRNKSKKATDSI